MQKYEKLVEKMKEKKSVAIAFSGGADSALVARACMDAGIRCIAVTIVSPLMARKWIDDAKEVAREIGIEHVLIEKGISEDVARNDEKRCYYCKKEDAMLLKKFFGDYEAIADGINASDDYMGKIAADEEGIWHPLVELGIERREARETLKELGLSVWKRYPQSCLATRIQGRITEEKLRRIEQGEEFLLKYVDMVRLRCYKNVARIETIENEIEKLIKHRKEIVAALKKLGFEYVTIDMEGYKGYI
ncbi:MAG: ATP-dependent sacrificial sulfur transferase LarE [Thermoplasmata archaeon]|nr:MAG: ATP-dependent sacrificial sulfur transferase LarE [Thermoplasmata archaeon]